MTSGTAPRRKAMTGVPHELASAMDRPNGSSHWIGASTAAAFLKIFHQLLAVEHAKEQNLVVEKRLDVLVEIPVVLRCQTTGNQQAALGLLGDLYRFFHALVRRDAPGHEQIILAFFTECKVFGIHPVIYRGGIVEVGYIATLAVRDRDKLVRRGVEF